MYRPLPSILLLVLLAAARAAAGELGASAEAMMELELPLDHPAYRQLAAFAARGLTRPYTPMDFLGYRTLTRREAARRVRELLNTLSRREVALSSEEQENLALLTEEFEFELAALGLPPQRIASLLRFTLPALPEHEPHGTLRHDQSLSVRQGEDGARLRQTLQLSAGTARMGVDLALRGVNERRASQKRHTLHGEGGYSAELTERRFHAESGFLRGEPARFEVGDLSPGPFGAGLAYGGAAVDGAAASYDHPQGLRSGVFSGLRDDGRSPNLTGLRLGWGGAAIAPTAYFLQEAGSSDPSAWGGGLVARHRDRELQGELVGAQGRGLGAYIKASARDAGRQLEVGLRSYRRLHTSFANPPAYLGRAATSLEDHRSAFATLELPAARGGRWRFAQDAFVDEAGSGCHSSVEREWRLGDAGLRTLHEWDPRPVPTRFHFLGVDLRKNNWNADAGTGIENREGRSRLELEIGGDRTLAFHQLELSTRLRLFDLLGDNQGFLESGVTLPLPRHHRLGLRYDGDLQDRALTHGARLLFSGEL